MLKSTSIAKSFVCFAILISFSACGSNDAPTGSEFNTLKEEIDHLAEEYVQIGGVIGIINKRQEREVFSYGTKAINIDELPDANTVFEIGSMTKTFTTTLLADMYLKGRITDDIVGHHLPVNEVTLPAMNDVEITFIQLATHTSGIPRSPHAAGSGYNSPNGYDNQNPYAGYTTEEVYNYLTNHAALEFEPGTWWSYSNTGMGLLGHVLGLIDGTSYETILKRDIFDELGMDNSSLFLTESQLLNTARGHDVNFQVLPEFIANDIFQGAGFIKTSLNDMFMYLEAEMGLTSTSLRQAIDLTHEPVMHQGSMGEQCLAWWRMELDDGQVIFYTGGDTIGHSSYLGFNKNTQTGVIILLNASLHDGTNLTLGPKVMKAINRY